MASPAGRIVIMACARRAIAEFRADKTFALRQALARAERAQERAKARETKLGNVAAVGTGAFLAGMVGFASHMYLYSDSVPLVVASMSIGAAGIPILGWSSASMVLDDARISSKYEDVVNELAPLLESEMSDSPRRALTHSPEDK